MKSYGFYLSGVGTIWLTFYHADALDAAGISIHNTATGEVALTTDHYREFSAIQRGDIDRVKKFYQAKVVQIDPADFVKKIDNVKNPVIWKSETCRASLQRRTRHTKRFSA